MANVMNASRMYRAVVLSGIALGTGPGCSGDAEPADTHGTDASDAGRADAPDGIDRDVSDERASEGSDVFPDEGQSRNDVRDVPQELDGFPQEGPDVPDSAIDVRDGFADERPAPDAFPDEGPPPIDVRADFPNEGPPPIDVRADFPNEGPDTYVEDVREETRLDAFPDEDPDTAVDAPADSIDGPPSDGPNE